MEIEAIRDRWNREARSFDDIYGSRSRGMDAVNRLMRKAVLQRYELALASLEPAQGAAVLDVGCGSGVYAEAFLKLPIASYTGVDVSEAMLAIAATRTSGVKDSDKEVKLICTDFTNWETDQNFDYTIAMGVLDYSSNPEALIRKMASLTTKRIAVSLPTRSKARVRSTLRRVRYRLFGKGDVYYYTESDIKRLQDAAGASSMSIRDLGSGQGYFLCLDF